VTAIWSTSWSFPTEKKQLVQWVLNEILFFNWWPMINYEFLFYSSRGITHSTKILRSSRKADTVQIIWCPTLLRSH
jgi:hypothetical protein